MAQIFEIWAVSTSSTGFSDPLQTRMNTGINFFFAPVTYPFCARTLDITAFLFFKCDFSFTFSSEDVKKNKNN